MLPLAVEPFGGYRNWLESAPGYSGQISFHRLLTAAPPQPVPYEGAFKAVLSRWGIAPYAHQAEALKLLEDGADVVLATPTASGKSLVFQAPVVAAMLNGQTALFIYPTKALARDQKSRLETLADPFDLDDRVFTYDGDTPPARRRKAREEGLAILTNPDMLHFGILPNHGRWARFLSRLRYLVIDEAHYHRGVFGSHVALILRRLLRLAAHYGAEPQIIAASATIANPAAHSAALTGRRFAAVTGGGRKSELEFVVWLPRALDASGERRRSANLEAAELAVWAATHDLKTLIFTGSRKTAELISRYTRGTDVEGRIRSYRAGYTAADRAALEEAFRAGEISVLVSTSALELGIDIGGLDAVIMVGYPGSVNSFWQRAGRAGRGRERALVLWIPREDPLDEYFLQRPEVLLGSPPESAVADWRNSYLYPLHLHCAAREKPVAASEPLCIPELAEEGGLERKGGVCYTPYKAPHRRLSLRGSGVTFTLKNALGETLGHLDERQAYWEAHPGAVYLHQGESYLVRNLDARKREIVLLPSLEDYYTQPRARTEILVYPDRASEVLSGVWVGRVRMSEQVVGYVKKRYVTEAVLEEVELEMPEVAFDTEAVWFHPPTDAVPPELIPHGIHALEHAMIGLLPLFVLAERRDVGGVSYPIYPHELPSGEGPVIFIYDGYPGGVGYARAGAEQFARWIRATHELLASCPCKNGCPRCILSPKCGNGNQFLDKQAALELAASLSLRYPALG
ncbi:DEAD/DEAH box helicase [Oceanithermus sp.]